MVGRWNPWRSLREWGPRVDFEFAALPPGIDGISYPLPAERAGIELDFGLGWIDRNATLGHEIIHVERRIWFPPGTPPALVVKEEGAVERELAERLVPSGELALWVAMRSELEPVTTAMVAEEFQVPSRVARRAAWLLTQRQGV